jgi:predicted metal-dependent peptidase
MPELGGVLLHEVHHVLLRHVFLDPECQSASKIDPRSASNFDPL